MKECLSNADHSAYCLKSIPYFIIYFIIISMCLKYGCIEFTVILLISMALLKFKK